MSHIEKREPLGTRIAEIVRDQPLVAVGAATVAGVVVGALVLRKPARLLFIAAAGFVATELWKREGKIDLQGILERVTKHDGRSDPSEGLGASAATD